MKAESKDLTKITASRDFSSLQSTYILPYGYLQSWVTMILPDFVENSV